jgi:tRNA(Arg) A34 adenosine deaminase TadA
MNSILSLSPTELDEHFLRRSFDVARRALAHGNHPFGAVLVDENRNVLIEAENRFMPSRDGTAHAERLLATEACTTLNQDVLAKASSIRRPSPARCAPARSTGPVSAASSTD